MTNFEHEKNRKLVQELKQRRQRGEKNLMRLNGEVVLRNSYSTRNVPSP